MPEARGAPRARPRPTDGSLVLLRHGESTTNAADRFTGRLDSSLTIVGIAQAHGAAALVAHNVARVDAIVSSPMLRARQTANVIAQDLGVVIVAMEPDEIEDLSLPPAQPLLFRMDTNGLRPRPRGGRPLGLWNGRTAGDRITRGQVP